MFPLNPLSIAIAIIVAVFLALVFLYSPMRLLRIVNTLRRSTPIVVPVLLLMFLVGCASPPAISSNPVQTAGNAISAAIPQLAPVGNGINTELLNAEQNLKGGVTVGILQPTDPVLGCVQQVNTQLGIEPGSTTTPAASFTPVETGPIDTGAALYVIAQQALTLKNGGITVPTACKAIIGDLVLKGQAGAAQILPGGGLLPTLH